MLVSILTPSFQQRPWLEACLDSVAGQTYAAIEHVVMDGGSTDGSVELLKARDSSVTWVSEPDGGQADSLNRGLERSAGEILGWVNSDDLLADRRAVAWVVDTFTTHPSADVVFGDAVVIDEHGGFVQYLKAPPFSLRRLRGYNFLVQPSVFFRRRAIEQLDYFVDDSLDYVFDRDLWFRLADGGARFQRLSRLLSADRHRPGRKVLHDAYPRELADYDRSRGATSHHRHGALHRATRVWNRLGGAPHALMLHRRLDPVGSLQLGSPVTRTSRQLLRPWSRAVSPPSPR